MDPRLEWDSHKEIINLKKHGVSFTEAVTALEDELALTIENIHPGERRFITLGLSEKDRVLLVVYTYRDEAIRIISARKATTSESKMYKDQSYG